MNNKRAKIILVDDSPTQLEAGKRILGNKYDLLAVSSGKKMFQNLELFMPDLILLDIELPEMDGYEMIRRLKANAETAAIPVIFLTSRADPDSELRGLSLGAVDYIGKPFSPPLLLKRIEIHLLIRSQASRLTRYGEQLAQAGAENQKVHALRHAAFKTLAELVEYRDDTTGVHIQRIQEYLRILTDTLLTQGVYQDELLSWDMDAFLQAAQLHDIGKIAISDSILLKPGKLTTEEFEEMQAHTTVGAEIIRDIDAPESPFLTHAAIIAASHHEQWDGGGYPFGLSGKEIPLQGQLMSVADVYDALVSNRPYRKAMAHEKAVEIVKRAGGKHFDPFLVDAFLAGEKRFAEAAQTPPRRRVAAL